MSDPDHPYRVPAPPEEIHTMTENEFLLVVWRRVTLAVIVVGLASAASCTATNIYHDVTAEHMHEVDATTKAAETAKDRATAAQAERDAEMFRTMGRAALSK